MVMIMRGANCRPRRVHEYESDDDTPTHPRDLGMYQARNRGNHEGHSNYSPKIDVPEFEGKMKDRKSVV